MDYLRRPEGMLLKRNNNTFIFTQFLMKNTFSIIFPHSDLGYEGNKVNCASLPRQNIGKG